MDAGMGLSRLRWILALAVAALTLVAAIRALSTYLSHGLNVGATAVGALAVTLVIGLASLAFARRRIGIELAGLRRNPPRGSLVDARRLRLAAIQAAGARPDAAALAEAAAAEESGRAYIGRYLLATTVLIGLVGTFAGLMETLGHVAPLLAQKQGSDVDVLALLASPLGGLHVTFGASLVAILATLSLALAQGDLALHETQALALLEDRSTHELVPELWPPSDEPAERTARAISDLRSSLADAVVQALEKSARRLAEGARSDGERAAKALESTTGTIEQQLSRLVSALSKTLEEGAQKQSAALAKATEAAVRQATATTEEVVRRSSGVADEAVRRSTAVAEEAAKRSIAAAEEAATRAAAAAEDAASRAAAAAEESASRAARVTEESASRLATVAEEAARRSTALAEEMARGSASVAEEAVRATSAELGRTLSPLFTEEATRLEAVRAALSESASALSRAAEKLDLVGPQLEGLTTAHGTALTATGETVRDSIDRAVLSAGTALDQAASTLAQAAADMRGGVETQAPRLESLTRELSALGREVALMAARGTDGDLGTVMLGELERVGTGVDRLHELLRLARSEPTSEAVEVEAATPEPAAMPEPVAMAEAPEVVAEAPDVVAEAAQASEPSEPTDAVEGEPPEGAEDSRS